MAITVGIDTYASTAEATDYCTLVGIDQLGSAEASLKQATIAIDRLYGARFIGVKEQLDQPLHWPRRPTASNIDQSTDWFIVDSFGNYRNFTGIPTEVKQATIELAVMIEAGTNPYAQPAAQVTDETVELDVIKTSKKYSTGYAAEPLYKLSVILASLLQAGVVIRKVR